MIAFGKRKSVSKVVAVIQNFNKGVSQQEIIAATRLSERSVKAALKHLELSGTVIAAAVISDLRRKVFYIGGENNENK